MASFYNGCFTMVVAYCFFMFVVAYCGNFYQYFDLTWGDHRAKIFNGGQLLSLSLDKVFGSGYKSKRDCLLGRIDMQLKLVLGNSVGTVTAYYLSSQGQTQDMMRLNLSSWETLVVTLTPSTPMSSLKEKEIKNNNSTFGLTLARTFTPIPFAGPPNKSCDECQFFNMFKNLQARLLIWVGSKRYQ